MNDVKDRKGSGEYSWLRNEKWEEEENITITTIES